jgi:hypothetical protein
MPYPDNFNQQAFDAAYDDSDVCECGDPFCGGDFGGEHADDCSCRVCTAPDPDRKWDEAKEDDLERWDHDE